MSNWTKSYEADALSDTVARPTRTDPALARTPMRGQADKVARSRRSTAGAPDNRADDALVTGEERSGRRVLSIDGVPSISDIPPAAVDAVRYLIAALQDGDGSQVLPTRIAFTSALAGEGVTFICRTVAAVLAHDARERVCLIDLNWGRDEVGSKRRRRKKKGAVDPTDGIPGLADAMRREVPLRDVMFENEDARLTIVPSGHASASEGQVFTRSDRLTQIIEALERHHDRLIFDLPPVLVSSAAIPLARKAEAVGLVVHQGVTTEAQVRQAVDRLGQVPSAGIILNRASSTIPRPLLRRLSNW